MLAKDALCDVGITLSAWHKTPQRRVGAMFS